jgi:hypothetical protein
MNACVHTYTKSQTPSTRRRGPGWRIRGSVEDSKLSTNKQHTLSARSVATGRCSTALTCGTTCPKTEPESSSRTAGRRVEHSRTWNEKATETLFSRKTPYTDFLFISHTRTVTPRYQPPSMADSVTSQTDTKLVADALTKNLPAFAFEQHRSTMLGEDEAQFSTMMCRV